MVGSLTADATGIFQADQNLWWGAWHALATGPAHTRHPPPKTAQKLPMPQAGGEPD